MNFTAVQYQLNDLPPTFKRPDVPYTQWVDSLTTGLTRMTTGQDGTVAQLLFTAAKYGWLDLWGNLFGLPRRQNEADSSYMARIAYSLVAGGGPPKAIAAWILATWGITVSVTERLPLVGYTITFPPIVTPAQVAAILTDIAHVRPAGIPFNVTIQSVGTYLNTINFLDAPDVTGAYLGATTSVASGSIYPATNNSPPLLPTLLLTDPLLNPGLAA